MTDVTPSSLPRYSLRRSNHRSLTYRRRLSMPGISLSILASLHKRRLAAAQSWRAHSIFLVLTLRRPHKPLVPRKQEFTSYNNTMSIPLLQSPLHPRSLLLRKAQNTHKLRRLKLSYHRLVRTRRPMSRSLLVRSRKQLLSCRIRTYPTVIVQSRVARL